MVKRFFVDRYNENKIWEVTKLSGGNYYVKEWIKGIFYSGQYGKGCRMSKQLIDEIGMMNGEEIFA